MKELNFEKGFLRDHMVEKEDGTKEQEEQRRLHWRRRAEEEWESFGRSRLKKERNDSFQTKHVLTFKVVLFGSFS